MNVSPDEDLRELIRFLRISVGHPVVLGREDCALLADCVERVHTKEGMPDDREEASVVSDHLRLAP